MTQNLLLVVATFAGLMFATAAGGWSARDDSSTGFVLLVLGVACIVPVLMAAWR